MYTQQKLSRLWLFLPFSILIGIWLIIPGCSNYEQSAPSPYKLEQIEQYRQVPKVFGEEKQVLLDSIPFNATYLDSLEKWTATKLTNIQTIKDQLDSLVVWTHLYSNTNEAQALFFAERANQIATNNNLRIYEAISKYYLSYLNSREKLNEFGLEVPLADATWSKKLLSNLHRPDWATLVNSQIGILYNLSESKQDSAKIILEQTLANLDEQPLDLTEKNHLRGLILHNLGNNCFRLNSNNPSVCLDYYLETRDLYAASNNRSAQSSLNIGLAYVYLGQAYVSSNINEANENFNLAEDFVQQSIEYANQIGDLKLYWQSCFNFAYLKYYKYQYFKEDTDFQQGINYLDKASNKRNTNLSSVLSLKGTFFKSKCKVLNQSSQIDSISLFLDSALVNYKNAALQARNTGAYYELPGIINNISKTCEDKSELTNNATDCNEILDENGIMFANNQYEGALVPIKASLAKANQLISQGEKRIQENLYQSRIQTLRGTSIIVLLILGFIFTILYQRQQNKKLEAKMEALRAQINPHFISNSLNAIESLVNLDQKEAAAKYIIHFSRLSRKILNRSRGPVTTLRDEMDTLKHFLALEQLRFRDKLSFEIKIDPALPAEEVQIPALLLQPYVENAIWHGIKPKQGKGHLTVMAIKEKNQLVCSIEDDGIGREKAQALKAASVIKKQKSMGMQITKERIQGFGGKRNTAIEIIDLKDKNGNPLGTKVRIRLPLKLKKLTS